MSEAPKNLKPDSKEWNGTLVAKHTAKLIKDGIENNSAPFIPTNGPIPTKQIINVNTGYILPAANLIPAQIEKLQKGFESNYVATISTIVKNENSIWKDEKGLFYNFQDKQTGEFKHSQFFFADQTENPEKLNDLGDFTKKQRDALSNLTISASSADDYMTAYIAACKSGAAFDASPETISQFKEKILAICANELKRTEAEKNPSIPKLNKYLFECDSSANNMIKEICKANGITKDNSIQKPVERTKERETGYC